MGEADSFKNQPMTWEYETLATMDKEEDILASTRPIGGGKMDYILFSVPVRGRIQGLDSAAELNSEWDAMECRVSLPYMDLSSLYY